MMLEIMNDDRLRDELKHWLTLRREDIRSCWNKELIPTKAQQLSATDASSFAGGIVILDEKEGSANCYQFSETMARRPICEKEAHAILRMLRDNPNKFRNRQICHFCDNQVVCHSFRNLGSSNPEMNDLIRAIYMELHRLKSRMNVYWCSTKIMMADKESRTIVYSEGKVLEKL